MKRMLLILLPIITAIFCHGADVIGKSWFPTVDGALVKAEYIDLNTNNTEKIFIRYSPLTDDGVELERTTNNVVVWRVHVEPIIPISHQVHSKYCHEVTVRVSMPDQMMIFSAAGSSLGKEEGVIYARSKDAKEAFEIRSLKTGELISRKVRDLPPQ